MSRHVDASRHSWSEKRSHLFEVELLPESPLFLALPALRADEGGGRGVAVVPAVENRKLGLPCNGNILPSL